MSFPIHTALRAHTKIKDFSDIIAHLKMGNGMTSDPQIVMVTAKKMIHPDKDSNLLIKELEKLDVKAAIIPWDDEKIDWSEVPMVLIRTPWDYFYRPLEFLAWAEKTAEITKLINPIEVIKWNIHKSYLSDLENKGVPIIPTTIIYKTDAADAKEIIANLKYDQVIIKPAISGGAVGIFKAMKNDPELLNHLNELLKEHDVLIQPFIIDVMNNGEISLIYFNGEFSHALHKQPAPKEFRVQELYGGVNSFYSPSAEELKIAEKALSKTPAKATYARVDLIKYQNSMALMELEVIEPELFLKDSKAGLEKFAWDLKMILKS